MQPRQAVTACVPKYLGAPPVLRQCIFGFFWPSLGPSWGLAVREISRHTLDERGGSFRVFVCTFGSISFPPSMFHSYHLNAAPASSSSAPGLCRALFRRRGPGATRWHNAHRRIVCVQARPCMPPERRTARPLAMRASSAAFRSDPGKSPLRARKEKSSARSKLRIRALPAERAAAHPGPSSVRRAEARHSLSP